MKTPSLTLVKNLKKTRNVTNYKGKLNFEDQVCSNKQSVDL